MPYHLWAKMLHPEDPPPHLLEAQKTCGGWVYFMWSSEIFLRNFLPYPPPTYSRVKGGGMTLLKKMYLITASSKRCLIYAFLLHKNFCTQLGQITDQTEKIPDQTAEVPNHVDRHFSPRHVGLEKAMSCLLADAVHCHKCK